MTGPYSFMQNMNMQMFNPWSLSIPYFPQLQGGFPSVFNFSSPFGGNLFGNFGFPNFSLNNFQMSPMQFNCWNNMGWYPSSTSTNSVSSSKSSSSVKKGKLFDSNTKLSITKVKNGAMPYLLIGPSDVKPGEKLPVLVYLHGIKQKGTNPDLLEKFNYDPAVIMKKWNLKNFRGYILCPQLPAGAKWCSKSSEKSVRNLLKEFESSHNIDKDNISLIGFSLGGAGALYFANEMSDVFKKAVTLSPYEPGNLGKSMKIPVKAFSGGRDDNSANGPMHMIKKLKGIGNVVECTTVPGKGHGQLPPAVFNTDADNNGCSDVIEWLFS